MKRKTLPLVVAAIMIAATLTASCSDAEYENKLLTV